MTNHVDFNLITYEVTDGELVPLHERMIKIYFADIETEDEIPESVRTEEVVKQFRAFKESKGEEHGL